LTLGAPRRTLFSIVAVRSAILVIAAFGLTMVAASCDSAAEQAFQPAGPCQIAFRVKDADYGDAPSDIHVVTPHGTEQRNLTRGGSVYEWEPVWSPDGRKIAFTAQGSDLSSTQIYVMNADGSGRAQLTADRPYSEMGTWSPDGRTIFYTQLDLDGNVSSWTMSVDGSGNRRIRGLAEAFVSPDGDHVAGTRNGGVESDYYGNPDVYVKRSNGEDGRWLTRSGDTQVFGWSPDGEWILYKRMTGVFNRGAPGLYVVKPDGSERRRLTRSEEYDATWSPDGESILYARPSGIFVVPREGGLPRRLTRENDLSPKWSPGGSRIVFSRQFGIWMINRDGTGLRLVARPRGAPVYESPAWSPSCK
jgi:Tol biopolymer transport system component